MKNDERETLNSLQLPNTQTYIAMCRDVIKSIMETCFHWSVFHFLTLFSYMFPFYSISLVSVTDRFIN